MGRDKKPDYSFTGVEDPSIIHEQVITPSTLENVDFAVYEYFDQIVNISSTTSDGFKKVPLFWVTPERSFARKFRALRDDNGMVIYPLVTMERKGINKDKAKRGKYYAALDRIRSMSQGQITVARRLNQDETNKFATADAYRTSNLTPPDRNKKRKNKKVVYETITMPYPIYLDMSYEIMLFAEYQQQMNEMINAIIDGTNPSNYFVVERNGHAYEAFVQPEFAFDNNISSLQENERLYKTTVNLKVFAYTIGSGKNENLPKIIKKQNAVEVKIGRERVIFDTKNPLNDDGFYRD
mgnify:CR=1 FL=1